MTSFGKKELGDFCHGDECVAKLSLILSTSTAILPTYA
jgi:hypothetical protein